MLEPSTFYLFSFGHTVLHDFADWRAVYVHVQGRRNRGPGGQEYPQLQISTDQLTLFQPAGADYAHHNITRPLSPGFSDLPTALQWSTCDLWWQMSDTHLYLRIGRSKGQ